MAATCGSCARREVGACEDDHDVGRGRHPRRHGRGSLLGCHLAQLLEEDGVVGANVLHRQLRRLVNALAVLKAPQHAGKDNHFGR